MAKEIALLLDYNDNYAKTVVDGVAKFSMQTSWRFVTHRGVPSISEEQLYDWRGDGVIGYMTPSVIALLESRGIPYVNVKTDFAELPACSVITDNREIGRRSAAYLIEKGFRRFAYTAGPITGICGELKFQGFRDCVEELGLSCVEFCDKKAVRNLFDQDPKTPLAVLAAEDFVGRMIIETCEDSGLRVPEDVAVLGVNNSPFICSMVKPQMSSMELGAERIGYQSAMLLDQLMRGEKRPTEPVVIAPEEIVERHSTELIQLNDRVVSDALRYIKENAHKPIQVTDIADAVCCGRRTLEKRFKELLERSPHEEIRRVRIRRACRLLRETDMLVEVLAESCGYVTRDRFNVAFRAEMGMTPSQYRKQYRFAKHS